MDETSSIANQIVAATAEIERLAHKRVDLVKELNRGRVPQGGKSVQQADFDGKVAVANHQLARIEKDIEAERTKERRARDELARKNQLLDEALEKREVQAYRVRRPPVGQGVRLTESDFRRAQNSVPMSAFVLALFAVVLIAVVAVANTQLPDWVSLSLAIVSFVVAVVFGLSQWVYAARADARAVEEEARRAAVATPTQPANEFP